MTFELYKRVCFFFFFFPGPWRYLICAASQEAERAERACTSAHKRTRTHAHSLACILHTHGGEQVTDTRSSRIKAGHLTWSSTRWATTAAASSVSASLRGRILRATCGTKRGNSPQIQRRPKHSICRNSELKKIKIRPVLVISSSTHVNSPLVSLR